MRKITTTVPDYPSLELEKVDGIIGEDFLKDFEAIIDIYNNYLYLKSK